MGEKIKRVYEIDIRATPDRTWQSLTDPELTEQYYFGTRVECDWKQGSTVRYRDAQGNTALQGKVLEVDAPRRLVTTFEPKWAPQATGVDPSAVSWEILPSEEGSKLTLTHRGLDPTSPIAEEIHNAWMPTLSRLKALLETAKD